MYLRPTISHGSRPLQYSAGGTNLIRWVAVSSRPAPSAIARHRRNCAAQPNRMSSTSTRALHSSPSRASAPAIAPALGAETQALLPEAASNATARTNPLSVLPLKVVLRSLATTTISSSPLLLRPSMAIMSALAHSASPLLDPDRNPVLRFLLKHTFYAQFCAGEDAGEVRRTIASLKRDIGFTGVILGYAREVVMSEAQTRELTPDAGIQNCATVDECVRNEIVPWAAGNMETVRLASPGDFVALKFTGAGRMALYALSGQQAPPKALADATDRICELAAARGVRLLFDAEQQAVQAGIDDWTLRYMSRYNTDGRAVVYGTYQAYLKATPRVLSAHLGAASRGGFALGVKLVRGAYLGSDPRHLMHDSKADTDAAYDGIAEAVLTRQWSGPLAGAGSGGVGFPVVDMVLASHNAESVRKGRAIVEGGRARATDVAFAQLQGMADEVSCELVASRAAAAAAAGAADGPGNDMGAPAVRSYKYLVWGTTGECMKYLLRRAQENRDAVQRTRSGRDAMVGEVVRRIRGMFGQCR
ncbi:hypothetical protein RB600_010118 [Gaeumannomyces tritici]